MDILNINPVTIKVEIVHPGTGAPTGLTLECTSSDSPEVKKLDRVRLTAMLRNRNRKQSAAELQEANLERLAASVIGFEWAKGASAGGKQLEFNQENVLALLRQDWLKRQVEEAITDEAAFFTN